eukprot:CAMPEP_0170568096 /NCGR_PEP_ID=MMETSP0211-20121228/80921_1 /TAXON_ID=311385 /ORGANISM="Pseudokeronopsis sp., Strain OXSARD2" /LENGTH=32 /DNA_ID= /DNA_START= /DNA_END= /DNA_ORIENTATION=
MAISEENNTNERSVCSGEKQPIEDWHFGLFSG